MKSRNTNLSVLIHCISWNAFGGWYYEENRKINGLNPLCIVECFRSSKEEWKENRRQGLNPLCIVECFRSFVFIKADERWRVLIHCVSWNAFGVNNFEQKRPKL